MASNGPGIPSNGILRSRALGLFCAMPLCWTMNKLNVTSKSSFLNINKRLLRFQSRLTFAKRSGQTVAFRWPRESRQPERMRSDKEHAIAAHLKRSAAVTTARLDGPSRCNLGHIGRCLPAVRQFNPAHSNEEVCGANPQDCDTQPRYARRTDGKGIRGGRHSRWHDILGIVDGSVHQHR